MVKGWGRVHDYNHIVENPNYLPDVRLGEKTFPCTTFYGQGRSYGDVALNDGGRVLCTQFLSRVQKFDIKKGILRAESGITLDKILELIVPKGWFLPVTPGSKFVSLGGAVANDVHGKNHHHSGSFGAHVRRIGLKRSDGETLLLSTGQNRELFNLTISGLGLTGFIEWVEIQLLPIQSRNMEVENFPYDSLGSFFELSEVSKDWQYTVAWIDCFASDKSLGRGVFTRARHCSMPSSLKTQDSKSNIKWPMDMPSWLMNKATIKSFNALYRMRPAARFHGNFSYEPFFFPLDQIQGWNKLYGRRGFFQHQCIVPKKSAEKAMKHLLETINRSGQGSFLAVMKNHGVELSPGLNSFCLEGTSLALDFSNNGELTLKLLNSLDEIVREHGGRIYPAKDGSMSSSMYKLGFPNWKRIEELRDPAINSSFWKRVTGEV